MEKDEKMGETKLVSKYGSRLRETDKNAAKINVSTHFIVDALGMPEGTKVFFAEMGREGWPAGNIALYVEHPDLPLVREGDLYPTITPMISIIGERPSEAEWIEWDWNLDSAR